MQFKELSGYLQKLEGTSSRIEITKILVQIYKKLKLEDVDKATYLVLGSLAPEFSGVVFGMAEKMVVRAVAQVYGRQTDEVARLYKNKGDLGEVTFGLAKNLKDRKAKKESVSDVYRKLFAIAKEGGEESQERKLTKVAALLRDLDGESAKYVVRIILGKLRLGFSDKTILDALSWLETGDKSKKGLLENAYNILPDVGILAAKVKEIGIEKAVRGVGPKLGTPLLPMLMARLKSPSEMIEKMGRVYVEPKFDGLRIQIHFRAVRGEQRAKSKEQSKEIANEIRNTKYEIRAFTRNLRETSWMFPELGGIEKWIRAREVILDSEAVGVDEERRAMANFQTTMSRRRKHDIEILAKKVSIKFNVFDVMYKDGKSLVHTPYEERRSILKKTIISSSSKSKKGEILHLVPFEETKSPERITEIMASELSKGLEGIAVKRADSEYVAGRTGWRWVKMKEIESQKAKLADTIDAVVMGYYKGRGKRASFGLGGFLVGIVSGLENISSLTKIGTGLSDEQFRVLKKRLNSLETREKPSQYSDVNKTLIPDVWVEPEVVVEIAADEITASPLHTSGFALRFPRLVRFREKLAKDATSVSEVSRLYKLQRR